jgi:hypothetical protein
MAYPIPEYREVSWTCQEEEVAEDKAAAKVEDRAEVRAAGVRAAAAPEVAGAAGVWDPEVAKGREPRIYAAARLVGPACRTNAGFRAFR